MAGRVLRGIASIARNGRRTLLPREIPVMMASQVSDIRGLVEVEQYGEKVERIKPPLAPLSSRLVQPLVHPVLAGTESLETFCHSLVIP